MMDDKYFYHVHDAAHELADVAVNYGGYADDSDESDRRALLRDEIEAAVYRLTIDKVKNYNRGK